MAMLGRPAARAPINTADIPDGIITSAKVAADVLTAADIAPNAVTASELADDAVDTAAIAANAVTTAKIADSSSTSTGITSAKIAENAVTMAKLSATGTASADTFLRGDNSWAAAGSPSITDNGDANAMTIGSDESVTFVGATSIPSIKQTDAQNLTGTYSTHEMIMGKTFTLTGDVTVNDNLLLCNLSGTGSDITITDDGTTRTIINSSTGTLEAGEVLGTNSDLTGMTGILGNAVTGSPALLLDNSSGTPSSISLNNATGTIPSGVIGPPGSLKLITSVSNVTGSITEVYLGDIFSATYRWYTIHLESWPSSDGGQLYVYPGDYAGVTWSAQGSGKCDGTFLRYYTGNASNTPDNVTGNDFWSFKYSDRANEDHLRHAVIHVFEPFSPLIRTQGMTSAHIWGHSSNTTQSLFGPMGFSIRDAGSTHGLKFKYHTGNINYRIAVYGVVGSGVGV